MFRVGFTRRMELDMSMHDSQSVLVQVLQLISNDFRVKECTYIHLFFDLCKIFGASISKTWLVNL